MKVSLKVLSYDQQAPAQPLEAAFGEAGGTIGRAAGNDWLLPDSKRFLSSRHARIHFADGHFALTDLSANGVFLNGAVEPVGKGNTVPLADGDRLSFGEYDIEVSVTAPTFANAETRVGNPLSGTLRDGAPVPRPGALARPEPGGIAPFKADGERLLGPASAAGPLDGEAAVSPLDLFPGGRRPPATAAAPHHSVLDRVSPDREAVAPGLSGLGANSELGANSGPGADSGPPAPGEPRVDVGLPADWDRTSLPSGWPAASQDPPADGTLTALDSAAAPFGDEPGVPPLQVDSFADTGPGAGIMGSMGARSTGPTRSRRSGGPGGLGDYLEGARVDDPRAHDGAPAQTLRQAGALSHAAVAALTELLRARSELKETVRTDRTLAWQTNNPLKNLALSTPEVVARLLRDGVDAEALVAEVAHDLKSHELAIVAGLQASLQAMLDQLDPARFDSGKGGRGVIGPGRKSKAWDAYSKAHAELVEKMEDGMVQLLRNEFARAYEEEVRNLNVPSRTPDPARNRGTGGGTHS